MCRTPLIPALALLLPVLLSLLPGSLAPRADAGLRNKVWVSTALPGGIVRFDLDGRREDLLVSALSAVGIAVDLDGNAWITAGNGLVWKVSPEGEPIMTVRVGGSPYGVAVDSEGFIWVSTGASGRLVYKLSPSGEILRTCTALDYPSGIAADPGGNVWVADTSQNLVYKLSRDADVILSVAGGGCPVDLIVDRQGNCWVSALCSTQFVYCYSATGRFLGKYPIYGLGVAGMAIDARQRVWVANPYTETVTALAPDGNMIGYVRVGTSPGGVGVDGDGYVWVANEGGRSVTRIDPDERRVIGVYPTNQTPRTRGDLSGFQLANVAKSDADFDGDGYTNVDEIDAGSNPFLDSSFPNVWRRGNVNTRFGSPANVLYVNDKAGDARGHVAVEHWAPTTIFVDAPPAATEPCRYVLFALPGSEMGALPVEQPFDLGPMAFRTPLSGGSPQAVTIANNFFPPRMRKLGFPAIETDPAPSMVLHLPQGFGREVDLTLQGFIVDPGSSGPGVSVTNVVYLRVR